MIRLLVLFVLLLQAAQVSPLISLRATLRQLAARLDEHRPTFGADAELTTAKHQLRDWIESQLSRADERVDPRAFANTLHTALRDADLLCNDCDWNALGYVDDVRVSRDGGFLSVMTAIGISCGYDESAYVYAWDGRQWRRVWEDEQNTYTQPGYRPQTILDLQISSPDASGRRLIMALGSQTTFGGAFKDLYARAWRMEADFRSERVLDRTVHGHDTYPPIRGRVQSNEVLFEFIAGGILSGDVHTAIRRFRIDQGGATQIDPIAPLPRDFVLEWLSAPWEQSRTRAESPALETWHARLRRTDGVGDFADPTLRCTTGSDLWQVATHLYEDPKRYYRVRWRDPYTFTMVDVSDAPYPDCTVVDDRGEIHRNLFQ